MATDPKCSPRSAFCCLGLCALFVCLQTPTQARSVWIDTDLALGSPLREVDDGYALLLAAHSPELRIAGISTTYGNAPLPGTTARTRKSLGQFGLAVPVSPGAASAADLGRRSAATDALAAALRKERLTYLALGPLTNLATFLRLHPGKAKRIDRIVMVGGKTQEATLGFGPGNKFRIHDANVDKDLAAVSEVLRTSLPIVLVPIETSSRLLLEKKDLEELAESGPPGRYLARNSGVWLWFWTHFVRARGGPIFDALAVVAVAQPALLKIERRAAAFDDKGQLVVRREGGRPVEFCSDFAPQTKDLILRRLTARPAISSSAPPDR